MREAGSVRQKNADAPRATSPVTAVATRQPKKSVSVEATSRPTMPPMALPEMKSPSESPKDRASLSSARYAIATPCTPLRVTPIRMRSASRWCQAGTIAMAMVRSDDDSSEITMIRLRPTTSETMPLRRSAKAITPVVPDRARLLSAGETSK